MPLSPSWSDLALRLLLTLVAGAMIGANREAYGQAAGLRTTMLVALAAAVAMIQANLLLPEAGKNGGSFAVMDVMRLPLGVLSGMGFIGAGAILRRGEMVSGVTTAATLWTVTVIGLCFGGGQLALGAAATLLAAVILWLLKTLDHRFTRILRAFLRVTVAEGTDIEALMPGLLPDRFGRVLADMVQEEGGTTAVFQVKWREARDRGLPLAELARLRELPGVRRVSWTTTTRFD